MCWEDEGGDVVAPDEGGGEGEGEDIGRPDYRSDPKTLKGKTSRG